MDSEAKEEIRIREVYSGPLRKSREKLYLWSNPDVLIGHYRVLECLRRAFIAQNISSLQSLKILDVGCGSGFWLRRLIDFGAELQNLHGIDLLENRIEKAKTLLPSVTFYSGNICEHKFSQKFDLVSAFTVFSSITSSEKRAEVAAALKRNLNDSGLIIIFDFWISDPRNPETVAIKKSEIMRLFPEFNMTSYSLLLAPPIARLISKFSPFLSLFVEALLPFLRSHRLYVLKRVTPPI